MESDTGARRRSTALPSGGAYCALEERATALAGHLRRQGQRRCRPKLGELAVAARGDTQQTDKGASHEVDAPETGGGGHLLEALFAAFELPARRFNAQVEHVLRRSG